MKDPYVDEIRVFRMEHTKKFDFNVHAICDDLRKLEKEMYASHEINKDKKVSDRSLPIHSHSHGR